jgi:putative flippase GtrA
MKQIITNMISHSLFRYLFIGGFAFATDYLLLLLFFYAFSVSLPIATTIGFISGLIVSFTWNRYWVFKGDGTQRYIGKQGLEYGILVIFNYLFTVLVIKHLHDHGIPPYISKILVMILIICWNYLIFSKIIFRNNVSSTVNTS